MKPTVVVIAPRHYLDELRHYYQNEQFVLEYADIDRMAAWSLPRALAELESRYRAGLVQGFVGLTDLAAFAAGLLNWQCVLSGPDPFALFRIQNKYLARQALAAAVPRACPAFVLAEEALLADAAVQLPCFAKPVRGSLSQLAHKIEQWSDLPPIMRTAARQLPKINAPYLELCKLARIDTAMAEQCSRLLCEAYIPHGVQLTLDGYECNGHISFFGITRSVFMPNHISFKRFDHPYQAPGAVHEKLYANARKAIAALGLTNTLFNIEYKLDEQTGAYSIVEINTRPSAQFMYPIAVATGVNPLDVALQLAVGKTPARRSAKATGRACSVLVLRREREGIVQRLPSERAIQNAQAMFPGLRFTSYVQVGDRLSDQPQDPYTFRYGEIVVPHPAHIQARAFDDTLRQHFAYEFTDMPKDSV